MEVSSPPMLCVRLALATRDRNLASSCATELTRLGFHVTATAPRGVTFEGTPELLAAVFETEVRISDESCQFVGEPKLSEALCGAESIYFPTRPTFFESFEEAT